MQNGWFVIINPKAGKRKSERIWSQCRDYLQSLGEPFAFEFTNSAMHAADIAHAAVLAGYKKLFIVGGDGTLNEVLNGVFAQKVVPTKEVIIGIVSIGTGNDFIKTLGIPKKQDKALALLKTGRSRLIDTGLAHYQEDGEKKQRYFINVAGMAFDAEVTRYANRNKTGIGQIQYTWSLVRSLFYYKSTRIKLQVDEQVVEDIGFCLNVGNCRYAGGGMMIVPQAVPDDGLFHVTFIKNLSKWDVVKNIGRLFNGAFINHPKVSTSTGKHIIVHSEPPIYLEVEGETLGHSPFEFTIIPGSIQILVP